MYRNTSDKRVKQTAGQLFEALTHLLDEKPFSEIGIKEISEAAGIGRATFYRNFDHIEDILKLKLDEKFIELNAVTPNDPNAATSNALPFFLFWSLNSSILEVLVKAKRWNIFTSRIDQEVPIRLEAFAKQKNLSDMEKEYLFSCLTGIATSLLQTWIKRDRKESPEELLKVFILTFSAYQHGSTADTY